jgi:hypothetical protein
VLRHGFYVGALSLSVAVFTIGIMSGPAAWPFMLLECGAGLFLGLTMKHRMGHFWIVILGTTSGALAFYVLLIAVNLLAGIPLSDFVRSLQTSTDQLISLVGAILTSVGLGHLWHLHLLPVVNAIVKIGFKYWVIGFYMLSWITVFPVVIVVYYVTNLFTRLLGYRVRPFASTIFEGPAYRILRTLTRLIPERSRVGRYWFVQNLRKEVRRLGIARQRAK